MRKILFLFLIFTTTSLFGQSWGFTIGNFSFFNNNNNCYNRGYYQPVITYMPQNVYMRPYQYMPSPQPIIVTPPPIYYNYNTAPRYNNRCYNNRW